MKPRMLLRTDDMVRIQIARSVLEGSGIKTEIPNEHAGYLFSHLGPLNEIILNVDESDYDEAVEILDAIKKGPA